MNWKRFKHKYGYHDYETIKIYSHRLLRTDVGMIEKHIKECGICGRIKDEYYSGNHKLEMEGEYYLCLADWNLSSDRTSLVRDKKIENLLK